MRDVGPEGGRRLGGSRGKNGGSQMDKDGGQSKVSRAALEPWAITVFPLGLMKPLYVQERQEELGTGPCFGWLGHQELCWAGRCCLGHIGLQSYWLALAGRGQVGFPQTLLIAN